MSEISMETYGIHLSLLDGMEEDLLLRLHDAGITTREDLEAHMGTPEARRELARTLQVSADRIEAIHHLNFVFPSEQVIRFIQTEQRLEEVSSRLASVQRQLRILTGTFFTVWIATLLLGWIWIQTRSDASTGNNPGTTSVEVSGAVGDQAPRTSQQPASTLAYTAAEAEQQLMVAFKQVGPATGWSGPVQWSQEQHQAFAKTFEKDPDWSDAIALSSALSVLSAIENRPDPALNIQTKARAAEAGLAAFTFPNVNTRWSVGSMLVWLRLHSLSQGYASPTQADLNKTPNYPWDWNTRGFLQAETRLARLHALIIEPKAREAWSYSLKKMQNSVNIGRDAVHPKPEAWAREIWLPRAQVEFAVMGAIAGAPDLKPYSSQSPEKYLENRVGYIRRAYQTSPEAVRGQMAWLYVEALEAQGLVNWLKSHPEARKRAAGSNWVDALATIDEARRSQTDGPRQELNDALKDALAYSGEDTDNVWSSRRLAWEASMRPLYLETRAVLSRLQGS